jgi:Ribbon-helix-helix domain
MIGRGEICICGHRRGYYDGRDHCEDEECECIEFKVDTKRMLKQRVQLNISVSFECDMKLRNFTMLKHGATKGALSFEVERAIRQYLGEKDLDVLVNDKEWQVINR